jgi:uncharacterized protein YjaZ
MSYKVHILNASGRLEAFAPLIGETIDKIFKLIEGKLVLPTLDIIILDAPESVIPEIGLGGYSPNKNTVYIYTDPGRENFRQIIEEHLPRTLAHELNHCARWMAVGYGKTLFEAVISEGLAEHFDIEVNKTTPTPWAVAVRGEELAGLIARAKLDFEKEDYDHAAWFFGSEPYGIPRWAGYSIGYHLVGEYILRTDKKPHELVGAPAKLFLRI